MWTISLWPRSGFSFCLLNLKFIFTTSMAILQNVFDKQNTDTQESAQHTFITTWIFSKLYSVTWERQILFWQALTKINCCAHLALNSIFREQDLTLTVSSLRGGADTVCSAPFRCGIITGSSPGPTPWSTLRPGAPARPWPICLDICGVTNSGVLFWSEVMDMIS